MLIRQMDRDQKSKSDKRTSKRKTLECGRAQVLTDMKDTEQKTK